MSSASPSPERRVIVRAVPIELCQFIKFAGVAESGGQAKQWIVEGKVQVNGAREIRKRRQLAAGDVVLAEGEVLVVASE